MNQKEVRSEECDRRSNGNMVGGRMRNEVEGETLNVAREGMKKKEEWRI
jgi:hypothetical protein